jgi:eukaryotic-like serine/threonine-protein kinase
MPLATGTKLDGYELLGLLGAGGMGEVYRAHDSALKRNVAIKVLPSFVSRDPDRLRRFELEAQATAALNHPNILAVHRFGVFEDTPYLVSELLSGSTLRQLLQQGPIPMRKAIDYGVQIAHGLAAAHEKGIVHRDLKPENLFVTSDGRIKILDFGLAKLMQPETDPDGTASTMVQKTDSGMVVGTVGYMSPEQVRGNAVDHRTDIFAFGAIMYEMLAGKRAFQRPTSAETMTAILNEDPPSISQIVPTSPPGLQRVVHRCLEKNPEERFQSASDLAFALEALSDSSSVPVVATKAARSRWLWVATAFALVVLVTAGLFGWWLWPRAMPFSSMSVNQITNTGTLERIALSGDGKFLAEVKNDAGQRTVWIRNLATNTDTQILSAFPSKYIGLTFSPDANYLYFTRETPDSGVVSRIYTMPVFGGTPRQIVLDVDSTPSLSPDGSRFVYLRWTPDRKDQYSEIHIADKDGSNDQLLYTSTDKAEAPVWSPRGNDIAWIEVTGTTTAVVKILDRNTKKVRIIAQPRGASFDRKDQGYSDLAWLADGKHLLVLYSKAHSDREQIGILDIAGNGFHTLTNDVNAYSQLAITTDGKTLATVLTNVDSSLAYYKGDGGKMISSTPLRITPTSFAWADEDRLFLITRGIGISELERTAGTVQPIDTGDLDIGRYISICQDGHILFTAIPKDGAEPHLFRMNGDGSEVTQITEAGIARAPFCTPDSRQAYFTIRDDTDASLAGLWSKPLAGGSPRKEFEARARGSFLLTPDAKFAELILVHDLAESLEIVDLASRKIVHQLPLDMSYSEGVSPLFSPDGKAIVGAAISKDGNTLRYQPIDGSPAYFMIDPTRNTITDFAWSPSGSKLGVLQLRKTSDVVLITDLARKKPL